VRGCRGSEQDGKGWMTGGASRARSTVEAPDLAGPYEMPAGRLRVEGGW